MKLDRTRIAILERSQPELLDLTFLVLREFFLPIVGLVAVLAVPLAILNYWLLEWMAADLIEDFTVMRYLWNLSLLVYIQAPLAGVFATAYLGKVTFFEEPRPRELLKDLWSVSHRLLWTQGILRCVLLAFWLVWNFERDDTFSPGEGFLPFVCFFLFIWRSLRPYINEIVLLERSPLYSSKVITVGKRSSRLHSPNAGDLFGRSITMIPVTLVLGAAFIGLLWFLIATVTNNWSWDVLMVHVGFQSVLWILVVYVTVFRFLSYLDLRIRREGWEVELKMRAEGTRMAERVAFAN